MANFRLLLSSFVLAASFVVLLCLLFEPRWETNDDIAMSMVAHGYGIAAKGSPDLIFSSVLWGYLVRMIHPVDGVLGYSLATLGVLVVIGGAIVYGLCRAGLGYIISIGVMALILTRPVLFPQFTMNAGLLMVAAVVCWQLAARLEDARALAAGCLLAFFSYLVRSQEFGLVLLVAMPLLPWGFFFRLRLAGAFLLVLAMAIAFAAAIDHRAYQGGAWKAFNDLNPVRAPFTDYGAAELLRHRPNILKRHGYSSNDIDLIRLWFFVDRNIADPKALRAMIDDLGPLPSTGYALNNAILGAEALWNPRLVLSLLVGLLLLACRPSWRVAASWLLCVAAVSIIGLLGRPGILRVYEPLVGLLLVAPLLQGRIAGWRRQLALGAILVAATASTYAVCSESQSRHVAAEQVRQELAGFPEYPVVIWGGAFPFEEVYPVLGASPTAMSYQFYGLGVFTLAPFSVPYAEHEVGRGMVELLKDSEGVALVANDVRIGYLKVYCGQRLHGQLRVMSSEHYGQIIVNRFRCDVAP
jgi:hypothetical protein